MTGVGGERKTEPGFPGPTNRHPGKCKVSAEDGDKDSPKARKTQNHNGYGDRKSTGKLRAKARTALPGIRAPHRSVGVGRGGG